MRPDLTAAVAALFLSTLATAASPQGTTRYQTDTLATSEPMETWGGMGGLVMDTEGYLWHSDFGSRLWRVHSKTGEVRLFGEGYMSASGIDVLPDGDILQAEFGADRIMRVNRFRPHQMEVFTNTGLRGPVGLEVVRGRGIYVANCIGGNIASVPEEGGPATVFATHELFNCPNGITSAPDGTLYVVNNSDTYVFSIAPDGDVSVFAHLPGIGHGHIEYARGALYVTQLWSHKVVRLDMDGTTTTVAGDGRPGLEDGFDTAARVTHPNGLAGNPGGSVLYHNNIDGPMMINDGAKLVIRRTYLPTLTRVVREAFYANGIDAMLSAYDRFAAEQGDPASFGFRVQGVGVILQQQGHHNAAIALLEHHLNSSGRDAPTLQLLGDIEAIHGDRERARALYEEALALDQSNPALKKRLEDLP